MTNDEWTKELKKNTLVMKKTFEDNELELLSYSFVADGDNLHFLVEISSVNEEPDVDYFSVKLNLYNADGDILAVYEETTFDFPGYDTFDMRLGNVSKCMSVITKARLYIKKE